jgi:geranylgeranyl pyrophosphate synthase
VLAGVALLNQAYAVLSRSEAIAPAERLGMVEALADAVGMEGLCAGQALDLGGPAVGLAELRDAHHRKTGVLFMAAVTLGALAGGATVTEHLALERFAAELGLAFQARDDIADAADAEGQSLIRLLGRDGAAQEADRRLSAARQALQGGGARLEPLGAYIDLLVPRRVTEPIA